MTLWLALGPKAERDVWFRTVDKGKKALLGGLVYIGVGSERKLALTEETWRCYVDGA
jgi:hypothetical protein